MVFHALERIQSFVVTVLIHGGAGNKVADLAGCERGLIGRRSELQGRAGLGSGRGSAGESEDEGSRCRKKGSELEQAPHYSSSPVTAGARMPNTGSLI
jgi:hypothetical protein